MASTLSLLNNPQPLIVVLAPLLIFLSFMTFGALSIFFTSAILFLSTYFLKILLLSKQKPHMVEKSATEENSRLVKESSPKTQDLAPQEELHGSGSIKQQKDKIVIYSTVRSLDVLSESESLDQLSSTDQDSEVDWPSQYSRNRNPDYSGDGSISDIEESDLIEIALHGGHTVGHKEGDPKFSFEQSIFQQRGLMMELLAEFNEMYEEENLIEIDISMGSIKCTGFEIEA